MTDMTPEERQQVIQALELADVLAEGHGSSVIRKALAIMRRDADQHEELARWMREHDAGGS